MKARLPPAAANVFVAASGQALPRWLEAFPGLRCVGAGAPLGPIDAATLVWLRIDAAALALKQVEALRQAAPGAPILVLADQPDDEQALPLFSAGIRAYLNAHATAANLRQVAQVVRAGGLWIGPGLMARLLKATQRALPPPAADTKADARLAVLTQRELEVARKIADGASNKEVARDLDITERTVKAHAGAIFEKLGARDRLHLSLIVHGRERRPSEAPSEAREAKAVAVKTQASERPAATRGRRETPRC